MIEINELPDSLKDLSNINVREVPQLKYVVEMSEKLCPDVGILETNRQPHLIFQGGTYIFLKRYFGGKIDTSFKEAYQNHADLQATLRVYGIDPTAFWYLILFLKDYVDDESSGQKRVDSAYTLLYNMASRLYEMGFCVNPQYGEYHGCKNEGLLRLKVGKHWVDMKDDKALYGVFCALRGYLKRVQPKRKKELIDGVWEDTNSYDINIEEQHLFTIGGEQDMENITIPETYKISYFAKYMRKFLESFKTNNKDSRISTDKWLLTSRVIYTIGYSSDRRYNARRKKRNDNGCIVDCDFLKGNYKNNRYPDEVKREIYV